VWAATPTIPGTNNTKPADETMTASYEVVKKWDIEVIPNNPKDAEILDFPVLVTDVGGAGSKNGNLGLVRVETNSPGWDVTFTTANGGKLAFGSKTMGKAPSFDLGCMCIVDKDTGYVYGAKEYLKYLDASTTPAQLKVGIGLYDKVNGTTFILKGIATQQVSAAYNAAAVDAAKLTGSATTDVNGDPITPAIGPVSIVDVLTTATTGLIGVGTPLLTVGGVTIEALTAGATGFGPTNTPYTGTNAVPTDDSEYFFINVRLPSKLGDVSSGEPLGGNTEGVYEETFSFTLKAAF